MSVHIPQPNEIYKHFKGNCYRIITLAEHTETGEMLVIYQALYGEYRIFARELSMFTSLVDREKYPEVEQKYRFELLQQTNNFVTPVKKEEAACQESPVSQQVPVEKQEENTCPELDPRLLDYLDADTYLDRLQILASMKDSLTDEMINTMAVAIDVEIKEGRIEDRYEELKFCLQTRERFECNRLR